MSVENTNGSFDNINFELKLLMDGLSETRREIENIRLAIEPISDEAQKLDFRTTRIDDKFDDLMGSIIDLGSQVYDIAHILADHINGHIE